MAKLSLALSIIAVGLGGVALVLTLGERDASERIVFTQRERRRRRG